MGIRIDGASDLINATDGSLTIEGQSINSTGVGTFSGGVKVGSAATIHSTGQFNIGVAATIFASGNATFAGIVTTAQLGGDVLIEDKIVHAGDTNTAIRFPSADTISFEAGGEEHCRVLETGNFLVGATAVEDWDGSRGHRLQVRGTSSNNAGMSVLITANDDNPSELVLGKSRSTGNTIVGSADDVGQIRWSANDGAGFHSIAWIRGSMDGTPGSDDLPSKLTFGTSADGGTTVSERLRITSNGFVGIGTDNPYSALTIKTTAEPALTGNLADHGILLHAPGATKNDVLAISASFINNNYQPRCAMGFISHPTADPIEGYAGEIGFYTRDAADGSAVQPGDERVRINRAGRVGVGTTSPGNLLHTYKATSDGLQLQSPSGQHYIYAIQANDNLANGTLAGELGIRGKNGVAISGNNGTSCQVHINSNGLCLGGTGSSNALDDYETGSWTPVLNKSGDSGSVSSYTNQVGKYIRIGKMLWISFYLYKSTGSFGNLANQWYISGVPFALTTQASAAYQFIPCGYFTMNGSSQAQDESNSRWQSNSTNGNTTITMYGKSASTNWTSSSIEVSGVGCLELA